MAKDKFTLMDFVKRQGHGIITGIFGEECLNEDGTLMSFAVQTAVITHYQMLKGTPFKTKYQQTFMGYMDNGFIRHIFRAY